MTNITFRNLTIVDFKSFNGKHVFKLDRGPGLYYVGGLNKVEPELGANGAGKTSLWDALTWVLYGRTGKDKRPGAAVLPWSGGSPRVTVSFERSDGIRYALIRTRKPNSLELKEKGVWRDITQDEINKLVMTEEAFRQGVLRSQSATLFMDFTPEQQSRMFNEALDLDTWLKASDRAATEKRYIEGTIQTKEYKLNRVEGQIEELSTSIKSTKKESREYKEDREVRRNRVKLKISSARKALKKFPHDFTARLTKADDQIKDSTTSLTFHKGEIQKYADRIKLLEREKKWWEGEVSDKNNGDDPTCIMCHQIVDRKYVKGKIRKVIATIYAATSMLNLAKSNVNRATVVLDTKIRNKDRELKRQAEKVDLQNKIKSLMFKKEMIDRETNIYAESLEGLIERKNSNLALSDKLRRKIAGLKSKAKMYSYWSSSFKDIRLDIIDQVLDELSMASTKYAEALGLNGWQIEFKTEKESKTGNVSMVFQVLLYPPGQEKPVKWENYSGGESQRWQLAVSFGLADVIMTKAGVGGNIEVLDEPTKGLSTEGINNLLEYLSTRAKEMNKSIYVIEQHSLERGMFAGSILVQKDSEGSRVL